MVYARRTLKVRLSPDRRFELVEQGLALLLPHTQPVIGRFAANVSFDAVELADHLEQFLGIRSRRTLALRRQPARDQQPR